MTAQDITQRTNTLMTCDTVKKHPSEQIRRRRVSFSMNAKVHTIGSCTLKEKPLVWYTKTDYKRIQKHADETVKMIENGKLTMATSPSLEASNKYSSIGLGAMTHQGERISKQRKRQSINVVLSEQRELKSEGRIDRKRIAEVYNESCKSATMDAVMAGIRIESSVRSDNNNSNNNEDNNNKSNNNNNGSFGKRLSFAAMTTQAKPTQLFSRMVKRSSSQQRSRYF